MSVLVMRDQPEVITRDLKTLADNTANAVQPTKKTGTTVFFDLTADGRPLGRVTFLLDTENLPKTCENFRALCAGEKTNGHGGHLHYKGCRLHAIYKDDGVLAGGDVINNNGTGGRSIYGEFFDEAGKSIGFQRAGTLAMIHFGPHRNNSQFFVTVEPQTEDNYTTNTAFGYVTSGLDVLKSSLVHGSQSGYTNSSVIIGECGQL